MVSHTFSAKSIGQFEQYVTANLEELVKQWDRISDTARGAGLAYAEIDSLPWFNFTAFDIIGDLVRRSRSVERKADLFRRLARPLVCSRPAPTSRKCAPRRTVRPSMLQP